MATHDALEFATRAEAEAYLAKLDADHLAAIRAREIALASPTIGPVAFTTRITYPLDERTVVAPPRALVDVRKPAEATRVRVVTTYDTQQAREVEASREVVADDLRDAEPADGEVVRER